MPAKILRFVLGAATGFALWRYGTSLYAAVVAPVAEIVLRPFAVLQLASVGMDLDVTGGAVPKVHIPFSELTYNVILFLGLFATIRGLFRDRKIVGFALAAMVLYLTHVLATAADIMSTYSNRLGVWSSAHFSGNAQDFWLAVDYVYRIGGMFGIAFALWYVVAEPPTQRASAKRE